MRRSEATPPLRTCIATRRVRPQDEMVRIVRDPRDPGRIIPDPTRRLPGRGAWIVPTVNNYDLAVARRSFRRAFSVSTSVDTTPVRDYIEAHERRPRTDDREGRFEH